MALLAVAGFVWLVVRLGRRSVRRV